MKVKGQGYVLNHKLNLTTNWFVDLPSFALKIDWRPRGKGPPDVPIRLQPKPKHISDDLAVIRAIESGDVARLLGTTGTSCYLPRSAVNTVVRAQFRAYYFVHGSSRNHNYTVAKLMFRGGTENTATNNGVVEIRQLRDHEDDEVEQYPLYTQQIPLNFVKCCEKMLTIQARITKDQICQNYVVYLTVCYGTLAYSTYSELKDFQEDRDLAELIKQMEHDYTQVLSVQKLLIMTLAWDGDNLHVHGSTDAATVARLLFNEAK